MARVTVEDCVTQIPNRFELVMLSAHRARALASGAELMVEKDRDKNPVVALREIAEQKLDLPSLKESLIKGLQKRIEPDQPEEEVTDLMNAEQQSWIGADMAADAGSFDEEEGDEEAEDSDEEAADASMDMDASFEDADIRD